MAGFLFYLKIKHLKNTLQIILYFLNSFIFILLSFFLIINKCIFSGLFRVLQPLDYRTYEKLKKNTLSY